MTDWNPLAQAECFKAQIEAYQRQVDAYKARVQGEIAQGALSGMTVNIPKGPMAMKTAFVVYEVSNGFMAVVGDDRDNGTVVGVTLSEVTKAAEAKFCANKLAGEGQKNPSAAGINQMIDNARLFSKAMRGKADLAVRQTIHDELLTGAGIPTLSDISITDLPDDFGKAAFGDKLDAIRYGVLKDGTNQIPAESKCLVPAMFKSWKKWQSG